MGSKTMPTWELVDPEAIYPFERERWREGNHEQRVFYGPGAASEAKPWILVIRELGEDGVWAHVFHDTYSTLEEAKIAAERWEGPPRSDWGRVL